MLDYHYKMLSECPKCGSNRLRFSRSRNLWQRFCSAIGYCAFRCKDCNHRFTEGILWLPGFHMARCPKCLREDLSDWSEKYHYPPRYQRALRHVGWKAHRCSICRHNFISIFPRKRQFAPSWKVKKTEQGEPDVQQAPEAGDAMGREVT